MKIKGIDISRAQERFNFEEAVNAGVEFVIIRAGIRTSEDTYFRRNVSECERLGIPYGLYWYFEAIDDKMYGEELTACLDTIKGTKPRYPVFFDMEEVKQIEKLNNALRTDMAERFCIEIAAAGFPAGIYANPAWLENYYDKQRLVGRYDIWLAHWTESPDKPSKYDYGQTMWQWGVDNIGGKAVDGNLCFVDYSARTAGYYKDEDEPRKPDSLSEIAVGDRVRLCDGAMFSDGTTPYDWVYGAEFEVQKLSRDGTEALIGIDGEPTGWVYLSDLYEIDCNTEDRLKVGDIVRVKAGATTYGGKSLADFVYSSQFEVIQKGIAGYPDYIVIGIDGDVTAAVRESDLVRAR